MVLTRADRQTVIDYRKRGWSKARIEANTKYKQHFIRTWFPRDSPDDLPRSGRPSKVTPKVAARIRRELKKDKASTATVGRIVGFSPRTVSSVGKRRGSKPYHRPRRPLLKVVHVRRRLAFATKYKDHPWSRTVFGDEKIFTLHPRGNSKNDVAWRERREDVPPRDAVQYPKQVMYWGAISHNGTLPLVEVKGTMDAKQYVGILRKYMAPYAKKRLGRRKWWYLQDSAKPHTAKWTTLFFKAEKINFIPKADWPPYSPDANPIENLWSIVESRVHQHRPTTLRGLKRIVNQVWAQVSVAEVRTLINSERKRLADIRRARGGHTDY